MSIINPRGKEPLSVTTEFCGRPLTLEVNRVGFRSTASVLVRYGDTVVLGTAQVGKRPVTLDYFPLSVDYEEKFYAAGKISGSRFIKREGRPSDEAVLIGRLIDRPIRPLFPKGYRQEVQVVATVLSMDPEFRPDMVAMIAASSALMLSGTPFDGPVAGLRVGRVNGVFKAFLSPEEREQSDLDLVVAGIEDGITMVEAGAKEVPEEVIIDALTWAQAAFQPAIELQQKLMLGWRANLAIRYVHHTHSAMTMLMRCARFSIKPWKRSMVKNTKKNVPSMTKPLLWHCTTMCAAALWRSAPAPMAAP